MVRPCILPPSRLRPPSRKPWMSTPTPHLTVSTPPNRLQVPSRRPSRLPEKRPATAPRRSFADLRKGSRLPVRKLLSPTPPPPPKSAGPYSVLAQRREARQARSRPWAQPPSGVAPRRPQTQTSPNRGTLPPTSRGQPGRTPAAVDVVEHTATVDLPRGNPGKEAFGGAPPTTPPAHVGKSLSRQEVLALINGYWYKPPLRPGEKRVAFGDVTVHVVPRWIRPENVHHSLPPDTVRGQAPGDRRSIHGWSEESSPEEEDSSIMRFSESGLAPTSQLERHLMRPCDDDKCAWNSLAKSRRLLPNDDLKGFYWIWTLTTSESRKKCWK